MCVCVCVQSIIKDAVTAAAVGHPAILVNAYENCKRASRVDVKTRAGNMITTEQVFRNIEGLVQEHLRAERLQVCKHTHTHTVNALVDPVHVYHAHMHTHAHKVPCLYAL